MTCLACTSTTKSDDDTFDANEYRMFFGLPLVPKSSARKCDVGGQDALLLAAKNGFADVCEVLLKCRADVNKLDDYHQSPLLLAAWEGRNIHCVKVLLDYNATIDVTGAHEWNK
jgi:ankyrin repeat protein